MYRLPTVLYDEIDLLDYFRIMINVLKFRTFFLFLFSKINVGFQGWNSQNAKLVRIANMEDTESSLFI